MLNAPNSTSLNADAHPCTLYPSTTLYPGARSFPPQTSSMSAGIKMPLLNSRSINNKHGELIDFCNTYHPDVLFLCETWLTPNQQFNIPSYSCYRRDRPVYDNPHNRGPTRGYGGVALLIRNGVFGNIQLLGIPSTGFEAVAVSTTVLEPSHTTQRTYTEKESKESSCNASEVTHQP